MTVADLHLPDSRLVTDARDLAQTSLEPYLFNHVMRSWLFAASLSQGSSEPADPELLAVAAMLHDLGLTVRHATKDNRFEVDGANAARSFVQGHGIEPAEVQLVWDAIALHATRSIALHKGPLVALCHSGVQVDISGLRYDEIDAVLKQEILAAYPRLSLKTRLSDCLCGVIRAKPATTYDNFMRDFGERYVANYRAPSAVDRLNNAPFES